MNRHCDCCGASSVTLHEVVGYLGTYVYCPSCFGGGEQPRNEKGATVSNSLLEKLQARADELKAMPAGWDSYNGEPIDHATADTAVKIAVALAPLFPTYPPQIVPGSDGTVQVEFHAGGYDVEAWIKRA